MRKPVYIFNGGELQRQQNTLRFTSAGDEQKRFVPVETTSEIHVFGEVTVNTKLLVFLSQAHIPLYVYNYYGYWSGSYMPREEYVSGFLTLKQATCYLDHERRMELARTFVSGGVANMERVLGYYARRGTDLSDALSGMSSRKDRLSDALTTEELMALEGGCR